MPSFTAREGGGDNTRYYEELARNPRYVGIIGGITPTRAANWLEEVQRDLAYRFRPYQVEALRALDFFLLEPREFPPKAQLFENLAGFECPYYGFEMATGSGKTLLMAASIRYLHAYHDKRYFLIMTPPSTTIYQKTIREFDPASPKCLFAPLAGFTYNLVTGENYTDPTVNYDPEADVDIYIFNISKYFQSAKHQKSVDKPWEESIWRDEDGNVVSFRDHLKALPELVIITDEAHHFQKFTKDGRVTSRGSRNSSGDVIADLEPSIVLEFTATMVKDDPARRQQKPIYRYPLDRYINDGYGKRIRAWGISQKIGGTGNAPQSNLNSDLVSPFDQYLIILGLLVHGVKRRALRYAPESDQANQASSKLKPILLARARSKTHIENTFQFIRQLPTRVDLIQSVLNSLADWQDLPLVQLIREASFDKTLEAIRWASQHALFIHYKNRTDPQVTEQFNDISDNLCEIVVQQEVATEGWNEDNIYTILILSLPGDRVQTYVKQLVGRGLRLHKPVREFDEANTNGLEVQSEILHIVCDQGSQFKSFVEAVHQVRDELGLNAVDLNVETPRDKQKPQSTTRIGGKTTTPLVEYLARDLSELSPAPPLERIDEFLKVLPSKSEEFWNQIACEDPPGSGRWILLFTPTRLHVEVSLDSDPMIAAVEGKDLVPLAINASELETCAEEIVGRIPILPWSPDLLDTIHRTVISILQRYCAYRGSPHQHARRQVVQFLQQKLVAFFNHQIVQEGAWE